MKHLTAPFCLTALCLIFRFANTLSVPPHSVISRVGSVRNATLSINPSGVLNSARRTYPVNDPYDMWNQASGMHQMVEFYDYREPIPSRDIMTVLETAQSFVLKQHGADLVNTGELQYRGNGVHLVLYPEPDMKWQMWRNAVVGMTRFVKKKQMSYGWSFIVMNSALNDRVGWGALMDAAVHTPNTTDVATS